MATDKTQKEKMSVEDRLKSLYELQTILTKIDRIKTIRGELPLEVKDLEDHIEGLKTRIQNYNAGIEDYSRKLATEREKINTANAKVQQYEDQLNQVKNNREFDMLSKEKEYQELEKQMSEKRIGEYNKAIEQLKADIANTEAHLADRNIILDEKKAELEEIVSETRKEEEELREQALNLEPKIDARTLTAFKRIRKNARNGLGVVYIQRDACGGCFNRIPPQRQLEIKMRKKIIVCEYCGRILVDPELAGVTEENESK